jgi:hypothetical protein
MYKKNVLRSVVCYGLFLFLFYFTSAQCSDADMCDFNGFMGSSQWEEIEFNSLLKSEEMPGYHLMEAIIGKIAVTSVNILQSPSCKVSKYVSELIKFYDKNEAPIRKKHADIADLLDYIKRNLRNE